MIYPWQNLQQERFAQCYQQNRLPHAMLLKGAAGVGKSAFARYIAGVLLCEKTESLEACGVCRGCALFRAGNHPDFFDVTLQEKAKDIKVDQIRGLTQNLSLSAHHHYQVALIHPAESLNRQAANALLKTLEEPQGKVLIILIANQLASIPATITSRTSQIDFALPACAQVLPWLQTSLGVDSQQAALLLQLAEGAPLRALSLGEINFVSLRNQVLKGLCQLLAGEVVVCELAEQLLKQEVREVMGVIFSIALDVMRLQGAFPTTALNNQDVSSTLEKIKKRINLISLANYLSCLIHNKQRLVRASGINEQLLLEGVLLRWQALRESE